MYSHPQESPRSAQPVDMRDIDANLSRQQAARHHHNPQAQRMQRAKQNRYNPNMDYNI